MARKRKLSFEMLERRTLFSAPAISFAPHVDFAAGIAPVALVAGDFNGDGNQDLAVADSKSRQVDIFFGNGKGGFSAGPILPLNGFPSAMITGDFNGDGKPDLAVACSPLSGQNTSTVTIFMNSGSGTFALGQITTVMTGSVPGDTLALAAGDFNKDGILDLAVTDYATRSLSILLGNGTGAFAAPRTYLTSSYPTAIAAADFNQDGRLDLAVTNTIASSIFKNSNAVSFWLGGPNGSFTAGASVPIKTAGTPISITAANLTGSATPGLIVGNNDATAVVLANSGSVFTSSAIASLGTAAGSVAAADFNLDGNVDFVTSDSAASTRLGSNFVTVVPGEGNGRISRPIAFATGGRPTDVVVADFNNDGKPDIATANPTTGTVSLLLNTSKISLVSTKTVVTGSAASSPAGSDLTLTATITGSTASLLPGASFPTGAVAFYDGSSLIGTAVIGANTNQAVFTIDSLLVGAHALTAIYRGDSTFATSQSARITVTITPTATIGPDLVGSFVSSSFAALVAPGQTGTVSIRLTNQGNNPAVGALTNKLYLSTDEVIDSSDLLLIVRGALDHTTIRLNPGQSVLLKGSITVPSTATLGSYLLLTALNTTGSILEYASNDAVASPAPYTVANVFGTLGINRGVVLKLPDFNGSIGTFRLAGPGMGRVEVGANGIDLALMGTTSASTLTITTRGSAFQLDSLSDEQAIRNVDAPSVAVSHSLTLAASAATIRLASFGTDAADIITLGSGAQANIIVGTVAGGTLNAASGIKSLSVGNWAAGSIRAPLIGSLRSKAAFNPQLTLTGTGITLKSATIAGSVGGDWQTAGSIGSVVIRGDLAFGKLIADANISSVLVSGNVITAQILAGLNGPGTLGSVRVSKQVTSLLVGAGATPSDAPSGLPPLSLRSDGTIGSIVVAGAVDADSRFLAATPPKRPILGGVVVIPANDPRFQI